MDLALKIGKTLNRFATARLETGLVSPKKFPAL